jgi:hypothetical protein
MFLRVFLPLRRYFRPGLTVLTKKMQYPTAAAAAVLLLPIVSQLNTYFFSITTSRSNIIQPAAFELHYSLRIR